MNKKTKMKPATSLVHAGRNKSYTTSSLVDIFRDKINHNLISGELFLGEWLDVGTVERLNRAHNKFGKNQYE